MFGKSKNTAEMGLGSVVNVLKTISTTTDNNFNLLNTLVEKTNNFFTGESLSSMIKDFNLKTYFSKKNSAVILLQDIKDILLDAFEGKVKSESKPESKTESDNKESFGLKNIQDFLKTVIDFSAGIELLSKKLNKKFFLLLEKFYQGFKKIISIDEKDITPFLNVSEKFIKVITTLSDKIKPIAISMLMLAGSFLVLGLSLLMPTTIGGILLLTGFLYFIGSFFNGKNFSKDILQFSMGIGILTLALVAMSFVNWESLLKMFVFVGGLLSIFVLGKKALGVTLPMGMLQFAMGIGILTLALIAMSFVEWSAIGKLLTFMLGLTAIMFLMNKVGGVSIPGIGKNAMLGLGFGLGMLVLALLAMSEIPWDSIWKFLIFIAILGAEIILINKLGGSAGPMKGLPAFAFGLGLLVLAMFAMNELPWSAMFITLGFLLGLGLILKLYNPQSGMMMLMIGGGILALSIGLLIFKSSGFTIMDALNLAISVLLIMGVVLLLGIPAISAFLITGSVMLILLGVTALIAGIAFAVISALTITPANILNFVLSVGLLAVGFAALTPFILLALPAAVMLLPVVISALLAATVLLLISKLTITPENIDKFKLGVRGIIDSYTQLGLLELGEAVAKAVLFLPIAAISMLSAIVLMLISKLTVTPQNIMNFGVGLNLLVNSYNTLSIVDILKAGIKAAGILVITGVSMVTAIMFRFIGSLDIQAGGRNLYLMVNYLTLVMAKLETWKNDNAEDSIENIKNFVNSFASMNISNFYSITNTMEKYLNMLSDEKKWNSINKNLLSLNKNIKDIVTNINMLNLQKAVALERNLKILSQKDSSANLKEILEQLKELVGLIVDSQDKQTTTQASTPQSSATFPSFTMPGIPATQTGANASASVVDNKIIEDILNQINDKLGGKLKVINVSNSSNSLP